MKDNKSGMIPIFAGLLLIAAALGIVGYNIWEDRQAMRERDAVLDGILQRLEEQQQGEADTKEQNGESIPEMVYPDYVLNPEMEMPVQNIDGYDYIGILTLPSLGLELPVMSEWDYSRLRINPCRYTGSAYLHNMVICAHNYTSHFGKLSGMSIDDEVLFTDMDGNVFRYRVAELTTLQPMAVSEMTDSGWDLTLFTCTVGGRTRITVRCEGEKS